ncbi:MAG: fibronectin type III domain-containing protein [Thermoplasmata archaeon]
MGYVHPLVPRAGRPSTVSTASGRASSGISAQPLTALSVSPLPRVQVVEVDPKVVVPFSVLSDSVLSVPSPPRDLVATTQNLSTATLAWSAPVFPGSGSSPLLYTIYLEKENVSVFQTVGSTQQFNWTLSGLQSGLAYRAEVTASNGAGSSAPSAPVVFTLNTTATPSTAGDLGTVAVLVVVVLALLLTLAALVVVRLRRGSIPHHPASWTAPPSGTLPPPADARPPLPRTNHPKPTESAPAPWDEG